MSWLKFGKKKYAVIEHFERDDGEYVSETVAVNKSWQDAADQVRDLQNLDALFDAHGYSYAIVEMGALHND